MQFRETTAQIMYILKISYIKVSAVIIKKKMQNTALTLCLLIFIIVFINSLPHNA